MGFNINGLRGTMFTTVGKRGILTMIHTLTVKLISGCYAEEEWVGTLEIDGSSTLVELHNALQNAVDFDNDHLYEFFIARTERSSERVRFDDENNGINTSTVESVFPLGKHRKLFYMFDYGDSWLFQVSKGRKKPFPAETAVKYPRLISTSGKKPAQYPAWEE